MRTVRLLRTILANRDLRTAELAWTLGIAGQSAWLVTLLVVAHERAGVGGVAVVSVARTVPAALAAPFVSGLSDRYARERVLLAMHLAEAAVIGAGLVAVLAGLPFGMLVGVALVEGLAATLHRPSNAALLPGLARSPQELVGGNAVASTLEGVGALLGPILAGLVLAISGVVAAMAVPVTAFVGAALAIASVQPTRTARPPTETRRSEALAGLRALAERPAAAVVIGLFGTQTLVRGALSVLIVSAALGPLGMGQEGVGYLNAAIGAGALAGALATTALIARRSLATPLTLSLAAWGAPIFFIGLLVHPVAAMAMLMLVGAANASLDVAGFSLLQRIVPNQVRGRVFGALEGLIALTVGLGSAVAPALVALLGIAGAFLAVGLVLPVVAAASASLVRRADAVAVLPEQELSLLRGIEMFAPLPMTSLEALAASLVAQRVTAGTELIRQGEVGDRFYILSTGEAEVLADGRLLRRLGPGESFGEIALLRNVPRTASVKVTEDAEVYRLERADFLEAITGSRESAEAAERLVRERLDDRAPDAR